MIQFHQNIQNLVIGFLLRTHLRLQLTHLSTQPLILTYYLLNTPLYLFHRLQLQRRQICRQQMGYY